ncbi:MAG: polyphenol oxidase family protein [Gemmatimonadota bacterium]|nr:polyphenol oxidase family protein [Gemmatimonadota bacterium]
MSGVPLFSEHLADREVTESAVGDLLFNRELEALAPGLVAGITTAPAGTFSVSASPGDQLLAAYTRLAGVVGFGAIAVPRQIHGRDVLPVDVSVGGGDSPRVLLMGRVDGLVASEDGVLLASTAADCVPVYLLDPEARRVGLVHAGWRGAVGGILERGVTALEGIGADRGRIRVHLGPAICGDCYEVDRPVLEKFGRREERALVDLRGFLAWRADELGIDPGNVTVSTYCTGCGPADLHSHRASGGEAGRMAAFTGFRRDVRGRAGRPPHQVAS